MGKVRHFLKSFSQTPLEKQSGHPEVICSIIPLSLSSLFYIIQYVRHTCLHLNCAFFLAKTLILMIGYERSGDGVFVNEPQTAINRRVSLGYCLLQHSFPTSSISPPPSFPLLSSFLFLLFLFVSSLLLFLFLFCLLLIVSSFPLFLLLLVLFLGLFFFSFS